MQTTALYAPGDVRFEERDHPKILAPTDAVIRLSATCVCGSGWFAADAASVRPVAVVGDGAVGVRGGPAPVRRYLPKLIDLVWNRKVEPGKVFDLTLPLEQVADRYRAMDERRAIKARLRP